MIFLLLLLMLTAVGIASKALRYKTYDATQDYRYDFDKREALVRTLPLHNNQIAVDFTLPDPDTTLLLKLHVDTTLSGKVLQPSLTLQSGGKSVTEYLEPGAKGIRYINISPLAATLDDKITLHGERVTLSDQNAEMILFHNPKRQNARILVLAPHPDDAEIAAYGLYSTYPDKSYVVTITAGDSGPNNYDEIYPHDRVKAYLLKAKIRVWNSITVPLIGGVLPDRCINLGFFDGTLKEMYLHKESPVMTQQTRSGDINIYRRYNISPLQKGLRGRADWNSLVGNLLYLLHEIRPDIVVLPSPRLDNHPDHIYAAVAMMEAIRKWGEKRGKLFLYTNHFTLNEYYPYGNAGALVSPPPNFQPLYFEGVYSHTLPEERQKEKILALEAMNDLRLDTEWLTPRGAAKVALKELLKRDFLGIEYANYYRRAVRANELFFTVGFEALHDPRKFKALTGIAE